MSSNSTNQLIFARISEVSIISFACCLLLIHIVNLGKWILRYLFANLLDELIKRDEAYRSQLNAAVKMRRDAQRDNEPMKIRLPPINTRDWQSSNGTTPRANDHRMRPMTPGFNIGLATPAILAHSQSLTSNVTNSSQPGGAGEGTSGEKTTDYFTSTTSPRPGTNPKSPTTPGEPGFDERSPTSPSEESGGGTLFGKKFRMGMPFGSRKRSTSQNADKTQRTSEDKSDESNVTSSETEPSEFAPETNIASLAMQLKGDYERAVREDPFKEVESLITPSLGDETPVVKLPPLTAIIIQEETSGGNADLYRGTVGSVGADARIVEQCAPLWLGELLLRVCFCPDLASIC